MEEIFYEEALSLAVDVNPTENLMSFLQSTKRENLERTAINNLFWETENLENDALILLLEDRLTDEYYLIRQLSCLDNERVKDFEKLLAADYVPIVEIKHFMWSALVNIGYAYIANLADKLVLVVPKAIKEAYAKVDQEELAASRVRFNKIYHYALGLLEMYGICEMEWYLEVFNKMEQERLTELEVDTAMDYLQNFRFDVNLMDEYLIHEAVYMGGDEEIDALLEHQSGKPYKIPSQEEINLYAGGEMIWTPELRKLERFLQDGVLKDNPQKATEAVEDISAYMNHDFKLQYAMDELSRQKILFKEREIPEFLILLMEASNAHPCWENRGFSPNDLAQERNHSRNTALLYPGHPRTVVKVGRNEPCPCKSGKKYKKCCGA